MTGCGESWRLLNDDRTDLEDRVVWAGDKVVFLV